MKEGINSMMKPMMHDKGKKLEFINEENELRIDRSSHSTIIESMEMGIYTMNMECHHKKRNNKIPGQ